MSLLDVFRRETAKQRALRIPLDYAYQLHWVGQWKAVLTFVATALATAYCVWTALTPEGNQTQLNPGPLAGVHSNWNNNCQACHVTGVPLRGDADGTALLYTLVTGKEITRETSDQKCTVCHAGPRHHFLQKEPVVETCAACHLDHKGESADINRPQDQVCTRCHENIAANREETGTPPPNSIARSVASKNVTDFSKSGHPEFYTLTGEDPGNIRFSHGLHMLPGQALPDTPEKMKKKLADIPEHLRGGYTADANGYVQLDCGSCHGLETRGNSGGAVPSAGTYMQPIVFEQHCQACHPLNVAPGVEKQVPHGIHGKDLLASIQALMQDAKPVQPLSPKNPRPIPGHSLPTDEAPAEGVKAEINPLDELTRLRSGTCALCHGPPATDKKEGADDGNDILPANLQAVWFKNARFSHAAHRAVNCQECHTQAAKVPEGAATKQSLLDHDTILVPNMDSCLQCHAPGKARHDCAECHRYHDIDQPPLGLGGLDRGVTERLDWHSFMRPNAPKPPPKEVP